MAVNLLAAQDAWAQGPTSVSNATFQSPGANAYTVGFTTSASGALSGPGGFISLTFSGLTVTGATYTLSAGGSPVGVTGSVSSSTLTLALDPSTTIPGGTAVSIALQNLTNANSPTVSIATSADTITVGPVPLAGGGGAPGGGGGTPSPTSVQGVSVTPTTDTAGASASYTVSFAVYSAVPAGGTISLLQPGTTFPNVAADYTVADSTTSSSGAATSLPAFSSGSVTLAVPNAINAGDQVSVTFTGATNPQTASTSTQMAVSTSADVTPVSATYTIAPGGPTQLGFSQQPGGGTVSTAWGTQPTVAVEDQFGNLVTSSNATVALSVYAGSGTLSCTGGESLAAANGLASFTGCAIDQVGTGYQLMATSGSLASAVSQSFNIVSGSLPDLTLTTASAPQSATAGQNVSVSWSVYNSGAATASGSWSDAVYLSPSSTLGGSAVQLATVSESVYSPLAVGASYTDSRVVTLPAVAAGTEYLIFQTNATGTLTVSDTTYATSDVRITIEAPQLAFTTQPGGGAAGAAWATQPVVTAEDGAGNTLTSFTGQVMLALAANPGGATLACTGGTTVATAVYGVASFSGCALDKAGTGYTLSATSGDSTPATSAPFTIAAPVASGAIYEVGGTGAGSVTGTMNHYTVAANCWIGQCSFGPSGDPPAPTARTGLAAVFDPSAARIYALGGADGSGNALDTVEAFLPLDNCWTDQCGGSSLSVAPMLTARYGLAAVRDTSTGLIYAIGGAATGGTALNTVEVYNPQTNAWQALAAMPTPRGGLAAVWDPSTGRIYAIGGSATDGTPLDVLEAYNPQTNAWQSLAAMTTPRSGLAAVLGSDGRIYAIGGKGASGVLSTVEAYDPGTGAWSTVAAMPTARTDLAAAVGGDGRIYAIGGKDAGGNPLATVEAYTPATNSWTTQVAVLPLAAYGLAAAAVPGVSGLSVSPSPATAGASAQYTVAFTATSGLSVSQAVYLDAPAGTAFPSSPSAYSVDGVQATAVSASGTYTEVTVPSGVSVAAGGSVTLTITGVTNPDAANAGDTMQVSTSADPAPAASGPYAVTVGPPAKLAFVAQPGNGTGGLPLSNQPRVQVEDAAGNAVSSNALISLSIGNQIEAMLTCNSNSVPASNGLASFSGCSIDMATNGYYLTAKATGLQSAASAGFNVTVGPPAQLAFTTPPGGGTAGAAWSQQPVVTVQDAGGNTVASSTASVMLALGTNPSGGTLTCATDPLTATSGVASFSGCSIDDAGNGYTLTASASGSGITGATSGAFDVTAAGPLTITTSASSLPAAVVGQPYSQQLQATGGTGTYTWSITGSLPTGLSLSPSGIISGTAPRADCCGEVGSVIQVHDQSTPPQTATIDVLLAVVGTQVSGVTAAVNPATAGAPDATYTVGFTTSSGGALAAGDEISLSAPGGTAFSSQASDYQVEAGGAPVTVSQVDAYGTGVYITLGASIAASTAVTVTAHNTASAPVPGSAYALKVSTSGDAQAVTSPTYTLTAPVLPSALAGSSLTVTPSPLIFSTTNAPATLTVAVAVYLRDGSGNAVPNKTVTLRVQGSSTGGLTWYVNGGDSAATDGSGAATFQVACSPAFYCIPGPLYLAATDATDGITIGGAAVPIYGYNVMFTGPQYSGSTADLGVSGLPPGQAVTATFNGSPLSLGGACTTDSNGALGSTGTCSFTVPAGAPNADYPVVLTAGGLQFPASFPMAANPAGTATAIAATAGTPQSATVGTAFATDLQAKVTDTNGTGVSGVSVTFTVQASSSGAGATFAGGGSTATAQTGGSGVATAPTLTANTKAGTFTVTASAAGTGSASFALTVTAGAAASIQVSQGNPQATVVGTNFTDPLQAEVQDQYGNPVPDASVTFTPPASGAGTVQSTTATHTIADGVAEAGFTANSTIGQFQVDATTPGVSTPAVFDLSNASAILSSCDPAALASAITGQTPVWLLFPPNCRLTPTQTIVIQTSQDVTLDGTNNSVNFDGTTAGRIFDVEGGSLTLIDLSVVNGNFMGQNGPNGENGTAGTGGGNAQGVPGGDGGPAGPGTAGDVAQGGAMYIAAGATVHLVDTTFSSDTVTGGRGGDGGRGGNGGSGGPGGLASGTSNTVLGAADGGNGGDGGYPAGGGNGQGGAMYNAGTLTITGGAFQSDQSLGGEGGNGGEAGEGGSGGIGMNGPKGQAGTDESCMPGTGGGVGQPGGSGGDAGSAGASQAGASGGNGQGGAIYNAGTLAVTGTTFTGDSVRGGYGGVGGTGYSGGWGGIGGIGGTGGNGGQGGAWLFPYRNNCKKGSKGGGGGGNGGNGGTSGKSGNGSFAGAGGPGGAAEGAAIFNAGTLSLGGVVFDSGSAIGGNGGGGGVGGNAAMGPVAGGGGGGAGGCTKYISPTFPKGQIYPPCGAPGKGGKPGYGKQYGLGRPGEGGGPGGAAAGGAIYATAASTSTLSNVTYGTNNGAAQNEANLVTGGQGGPGGAGGYSKCALLASGGAGCIITNGGGPIVTGKQQPSGNDGTNGPGAGAGLFTAGASNSQLEIVTDSLPGGSVGGGYWAWIQATGGTTPYTWSVVPGQGSLPPGLSLGTTYGNFSGTIQQPGTYLFTVQVQDSSTPALTATEPLSITIPAQAVYQQGSTVAGSSNAASSTPGGDATAGGAGTPTSDVTASATNGTGQVAVTEYNSNPGSGVSFQSTGQYFDVAVSSGNTFQSVTIQKCGVTAGDTIMWSPDGATWRPVNPQSYANGCITLGPLTNSSSPTLAQLNGTPFAVAATPTPLAAGDTLTFSLTPLAAAGSLAPGDTVSAAVYARTAAGSAVADATVYMSLASGAAGSATADGTALSSTPLAVTTDAGGQVAIVYTAGNATSGTDTVAAAGDASASPAISATDTYTYAAPVNPPATVTVQVSPSQAAPSASVTVSGTVLDGGGNPVPDAVVDLTTSAGTLSALSVPTAGDGSFSATLTMPAAGAATVGASVEGASPPVTAVAIVTPAGVSVTGSATGTNSAGGSGATAHTTARASGGSGGVTVSEYSGNPGGTPTFTASGSYFDVALSPASTFTSLTITQCGVASGDQVYWWSGTAWAVASDQSFAGGCLTVTVNASTSPSLADLTGTPFAVGAPQSAPASGSAAGAATAQVATGTTVGAGGGTLTTTDGTFTMTLPAGAVPAAQVLTVSDTATAPAGEPSLPAGTATAGTFVTITGPALGKPVAAAFQYAAAALGGLAPDRLSVYALGAGGWTFLPTAVDATAGNVSANIAGPGTYVVLADTTQLSDIPAGFWAAAAIDRALAAGIVAGFPDQTFQPQAAVTRAQLTKMLAVALGLPVTGAPGTSFTDVGTQAWYAPYVAAAAGAGIVQGVAAGRFDPDAPVTREQMAVMLARALKLSGAGSATFTDATAIDGWATAGVQATLAAGLMNGFPDGTFQPLAVATRAQAGQVLAAILARMAP